MISPSIQAAREAYAVISAYNNQHISVLIFKI